MNKSVNNNSNDQNIVDYKSQRIMGLFTRPVQFSGFFSSQLNTQKDIIKKR